MKFAVVLLSLAAVAYAGPVSFGAGPVSFGPGKTVSIDEDGTLTILGESGKKIVISKAIGQPGPKDIEITVGGPMGPMKKIQIDGETNIKTIDLIPPSVEDDDDYNTLVDEERNKRSSIKDTKESPKETKESKKSKDSKSSKEETKESKTQSTKADVLSELIKEYQGVVDEKSNTKFISKVDSLVQSGKLNPSVYNVLNSLDQYKFTEKYGNQSPWMVKGYPLQYPNQYQSPSAYQQWYGVPENKYFGVQAVSDYYGQPMNGLKNQQPYLTQEQPIEDPWATYWQSIMKQKQSFYPWITLKRPTTPKPEDLSTLGDY